MKTLFALLTLFSLLASAMAQTAADSQKQALAKYPQLAQEGSALHTQFMLLYRQAKETNQQLLHDPNWPMILAEKASNIAASKTQDSSKITPEKPAAATVKEPAEILNQPSTPPKTEDIIVSEESNKKADQFTSKTEAEQLQGINDRLQNYRAGKWKRFVATMVKPTPDGQIMLKPDGSEIHVKGNLGIAKGQEAWGYFESDGNYDFTVAGSAERLLNYIYRADAHGDMDNEVLNYIELKKLYLKAPEFDQNLATKIAEIEVRLKGEGLAKIFKILN